MIHVRSFDWRTFPKCWYIVLGSRGLYNKDGGASEIPQSVVTVGQKQVFCIPNENSHKAHTHYYVSLTHSTSTDIRLLKIMDCYNEVRLLPGITDMKHFIA